MKKQEYISKLNKRTAVIIVAAALTAAGLGTFAGSGSIDALAAKATVTKTAPAANTTRTIKPAADDDTDPDATADGANSEEAKEEEDTYELQSDFAVVINADTDEILFGKDEKEQMYPASMTKVMTILTAVDRIDNLSDTSKMTKDIQNEAANLGLTTVGFVPGESVCVADMLYGTILPSGADAALLLANKTAGSQSNFAELMNKKAEELGLSGSHFFNCTGTFSELNYSTAYDIALIMKAAMNDPLASKILCTRQYTTLSSGYNMNGRPIVNRFLKKIEQKDLPGIVASAKTGFVSKAMFCAVSYYVAEDETPYICVTGHAPSSQAAIDDHAYLYKKYAEIPAEDEAEENAEDETEGNSETKDNASENDISME